MALRVRPDTESLPDAQSITAGASRLNIVVVDEELPYPPNSGKRIRTLNLLLGLARWHNLTYLCHRNADPNEARLAQRYLESHGIKPLMVERSVPSKTGIGFYWRLLANLASPLPYSVQTHVSRALQDRVRQLDHEAQVDLWMCEWTPYAQSVLGLVEGPVVVMAHNVESLIWKRLWENEENWAKRWYIKQQWAKYATFERRVFSRADLTITVSDSDARLAREEYVARQVAVVENGVDIDYFRPGSTSRNPEEILFLGSLDWRANLDAVTWLLDEIFPRVIQQAPEAHLSIVGRKPPQWLMERIDNTPCAALYADVPDVRPFLQRCGVMAVPLRIGGGSRLKILEALASECPVVSTPVGAEGLHLISGVHYRAATDSAQLAEALVRTIHDRVSARKMAREGRQLVVEQYDWSRLAMHLERTLHQVTLTSRRLADDIVDS